MPFVSPRHPTLESAELKWQKVSRESSSFRTKLRCISVSFQCSKISVSGDEDRFGVWVGCGRQAYWHTSSGNCCSAALPIGPSCFLDPLPLGSLAAKNYEPIIPTTTPIIKYILTIVFWRSKFSPYTIYIMLENLMFWLYFYKKDLVELLWLTAT